LDEHLGKRIKGIKKSVVENEIKFEDYKSCLFENKIINVDMSIIKSENHVLTSQTINKLALSPYCDKRYMLDDINSLSYGHYLIELVESN